MTSLIILNACIHFLCKTSVLVSNTSLPVLCFLFTIGFSSPIGFQGFCDSNITSVLLGPSCNYNCFYLIIYILLFGGS